MNQELIRGAKSLVENGGSGSLATQSVKHGGFPFVSSAPFAIDENGNPIFLLSSLATHTKNLTKDPRASLLVATTGEASGARLTLVGNIETLPESEIESSARAYLKRHPEAQQWMSFGDFQIYKLVPIELYFVAGFGSMGWIKPDDYANAFSN